MLPVYTEDEIRAAVPPADAVRVIRDAFRADGLGQTTVPDVINLAIPGTQGEFHIKTAYVAGIPHIAVKVASGFYENAARGLPTGTGMMALFDASTGMPAALLLDNGYLTDVRTGAAGAVAADVLARASIETVGVIGSGVQARHQIRCLREVRQFTRLAAWSIDREGLAAYCDEMRDAFGLDAFAAAGAEAVARAADVLITATPARAAHRHGFVGPSRHARDGPRIRRTRQAGARSRSSSQSADLVRRRSPEPVPAPRRAPARAGRAADARGGCPRGAWPDRGRQAAGADSRPRDHRSRI